MRVIVREIFYRSRSEMFSIVPIGDIHLGSAACDEPLLRDTVKRIASDKRCFWIGMGDYCDMVTLQDKRRDLGTLAEWISRRDLSDIALVERNRFLDIMEPIAHKCLALLEGNHETHIHKYYERAIYDEIAVGVKERGKIKPDTQLTLGYYGWLQLRFYRSGESKEHRRARFININLHHGFGGGRKPGGKANNLRDWMLTHDADLTLFGHSHDAIIEPALVERIDGAANVSEHLRQGAICGTFLRTTNRDGDSTYAERNGYSPLPTGAIEVQIKPGSVEQRDVIRIVSRY